MAILLIILLIAGFLILRSLLRYFRSGKRSSGSAVRVLGVVVAFLLAFAISTGLFFTRSSVTYTSNSGFSGSTLVTTHVTTRGDDNSSGVSVAITSDAAGGTAVTTTTTSDGEVLVLPLSNQVLIDLIGKDGVRAIELLNESVPPELRQAYAMIPISGPGSVLPGSMGPNVIPTTVRDQGLSFLKTAVSGLLSSTKPPEAGEVQLAEMEADDYVAPDWTVNPGEGFIAVESEFLEPSVSVEDALRPQIEAALNQHIVGLLAEKMGSRDGLGNLADVAITDSAIQDCIIETSAHTTVLEDIVGQPTMRQTHGLIAFPEALDDQLIRQVRGSLQHNRVVTLCMTAGVLWLGTFFLSIAFRAGQSQSILRKIATLPMLAILIVPCVVMFVAMSGAMLRGETFDLSWSKDRVVCVIDKLSE